MTPVSNDKVSELLKRFRTASAGDRAYEKPCTWDEAEALAELALSALRSQSPEPSSSVRVPKGWKLVPEEPTDKMMLVGGFSFAGRVPNKLVYPEVHKVWDAMLAAAPPSPTVSPAMEQVEWKTEASGLEVATIQHDDFSLLEIIKSRSPRCAFRLTVHCGSEEKAAWDDLSIELTAGEARKLAAALSPAMEQGEVFGWWMSDGASEAYLSFERDDQKRRAGASMKWRGNWTETPLYTAPPDYQALKAEQDEAMNASVPSNYGAQIGFKRWKARAEAAEACLSAVEGERNALAEALKPFARATDVLNISYRVTEKHLQAAREALTTITGGAAK